MNPTNPDVPAPGITVDGTGLRKTAVIPEIAKRGKRALGLLAYLYGPGIRGPHTAPHLVASWDGHAPDPGRHPNA
ncbi:hypothetical protein SAMN06297387_107157 [Streptomyces zhaozhouensis]|uniref:Uncharacterized protein n=1 Tax=Streptomyces zhaozhouensis TaxID=1300267 RepID=A0A286DVY0_9ACTN|nr:hypothetical protein [Streptomyces zhaozhouensis]SOD62783.1 hypothetical protein SAMN06297387_107157 [Streptomyces zhaozhouensis]